MKGNIVCNFCLHKRLKICTGPSVQMIPFEISEWKHNLIPPTSFHSAQSAGKWRED